MGKIAAIDRAAKGLMSRIYKEPGKLNCEKNQLLIQVEN